LAADGPQDDGARAKSEPSLLPLETQSSLRSSQEFIEGEDEDEDEDSESDDSNSIAVEQNGKSEAEAYFLRALFMFALHPRRSSLHGFLKSIPTILEPRRGEHGIPGRRFCSQHAALSGDGSGFECCCNCCLSNSLET
jgi:hypothetical protein